MAFNIQALSRVSPSANSRTYTLQDGTVIGAPAFFTYATVDDAAGDVTDDNYFADAVVEFQVGDYIYAKCADVIIDAVVTAVDVGAKTITVIDSPANGDVVGPAGATANAVARFSGVTGKLLKNGLFIIDDLGVATGLTTLIVDGPIGILGGETLELWNAANTFKTSIKSGNVAADIDFITPSALPAANGYTLQGNTNGTTQWAPTANAAWVSTAIGLQTVVNTGYVATSNAGVVIFLLPATAAIGDSIEIRGFGSSGWRITQNAGQQIHIGAQASTTGVAGTISSTQRDDAIYLVCVVAGANTQWSSIFTGNLAFA